MSYDEVINRALLHFLMERPDNYNGVCIKFAVLDKLPKPVREKIGFTSKMKTGEKLKLISKHLGKTLRIAKVSSSTYLYQVMPSEEAAWKLILHQPGGTPGKIPFGMTNPEKAAVLNRLAKAGKIRVELNKDLKVSTVWPLDSAPTTAAATAAATGEAPVDTFESQQARFKASYDKLIQGRYFVRICELRRDLGWDRHTFDTVLRNLRDRMLIQLHPGDTQLMSEEDVRLCFLDENGALHLNLSWRNGS